MKKLLTIPWLVLLASCGPSQEEKENVASITCSIMSETRNMDAAVRVREINEAREKIGGEPFLRGDDAIKEAFQFNLCQELVLNETYDETLQSLKDAIREEERIAAEKRAEENRIAAEKQRIADSKPSVKEEFYSSGVLKSRKNYQPKNDGGKLEGLFERFYPNSQLQFGGNYIDGKREGLWEGFHENGQLNWRGNYKDGEQDGFWEGFHENGQLRERGNYKNGKKDGLHETYKEDGLPTDKINWMDGVRSGLSEGFNSYGQRRTLTTYNNNKKDGIHIEWSYRNEKENILFSVRLEYYKQGVQDGLELNNQHDENGMPEFVNCYRYINGKFTSDSNIYKKEDRCSNKKIRISEYECQLYKLPIGFCNEFNLGYRR